MSCTVRGSSGRNAHDLIGHVSDTQIEQFQALLSKGSDSVGQARMQALYKGRRDNLELAPNLWAGIGPIRTGAGTALVGSPASIAERLQDYADIGIDTVIGSGYPHIEEAYRVAELLFPKLNLPNRPVETLPPVRPLWAPIAGQTAAGRVT
ncbi:MULTISPECIES: hypothetical protein [Sphingomonas]|uniref:hypothetical protein n=1 Tax=Sphingomonas TaxID=13687 RepID=UPI002FF3FC7F